MTNLDFRDVFNTGTLNIFTDASIKKYPEYNNFTISAPGAIAVITTQKGYTKVIDTIMTPIPFSTNNDGEISAIRLGIFLAQRYRAKFKKINLFSDSNICVQGLNDYIYKWYRNMRDDGMLISSSRKLVANQAIFKAIVNDIVSTNLQISIYHQRGHVYETHTIDKALNDFIMTNGIGASMELMNALSYYNNHIDIITKHLLQNVDPIQYLQYNNMVSGFINNQLDETIINRYKQLTRKD